MVVLRGALAVFGVTCALVVMWTGLQNGVWVLAVLAGLALMATAFFPIGDGVEDVSRLDDLDRGCLVDHTDADDEVWERAALRMRADLARDDEERGEWS
jgi:hypothetical protein